jgi:hypothetical protein
VIEPLTFTDDYGDTFTFEGDSIGLTITVDNVRESPESEVTVFPEDLDRFLSMVAEAAKRCREAVEAEK